MNNLVRLVICGSLAAVSGCVGAGPVRPRRDGGIPAMDAGVQLDAGAVERPDAALPDGGGCAIAELAVERARPRVLVLFDRSCSMRRRIDDPSRFADSASDPNGRWAVASASLLRLIERNGAIDWGLSLFPDVLAGCGTNPPIAVEPAPNNRDRIDEELRSAGVAPFDVCGVPPMPQPMETPTAEALATARAWASGADAGGASSSRFVVVITDGGATCGASAESLRAVVREIRAQGVALGAIGFGNEFDPTVPTAREMLESMGDEGGLGALVATNAGELTAVFDAITAQAARRSCRFTIERAIDPVERAFLRVTVGGVAVVESTENGWSFDASTGQLVLHGAACPAESGTPVSVTTLCSPG